MSQFNGYIISCWSGQAASTPRANCVNKLLEASKKVGISLEVKAHHDIVREIELMQQGKIAVPDYTVYSASPHVSGAIVESLGARGFNSYKSAFISRNKSLAYVACMGAGVPQPKTFPIPFNESWTEEQEELFVDEVIAFIELPLVAKTATGSLGTGVGLIHDKAEAIEFIDNLPHEQFGLFQEYIKESSGTDVRMFVVGDEVVAAMQRKSTSESNDFRANLHLGGTATPYNFTTEEKEMAISAAKAVGLDIAGVDLLIGEKPLVCEVNSQPFFGINDVCHTDVSVEIMSYIKKTLTKENNE